MLQVALLMVGDVTNMAKRIYMKSVEITCACLSIVILLFSCPLLADSILTIVDAKEIKDSGVPSGKLCKEKEDCVVWETYFTYKAKIKKVLRGDLVVDDITIAKGQHTGYVNKKIKNWMVLIQRIEDPILVKKLGAQYIVKQSSFPEQYYCFNGKPDSVIDELFVSRLESSSDDYFCYSLEDLLEAEE